MKIKLTTREIKVGDQILVGAVCLCCPAGATIYPIEALRAHLEEHERRARVARALLHGGEGFPAKGRYKRGRKPRTRVVAA